MCDVLYNCYYRYRYRLFYLICLSLLEFERVEGTPTSPIQGVMSHQAVDVRKAHRTDRNPVVLSRSLRVPPQKCPSMK